MKIQYISDIHFELLDKQNSFDSFFKDFKKMADILVLAGDVGYPYEKHYINSLKIFSEMFEYVILIHGNHEYYNSHGNKQKTSEDIVQQTKMLLYNNNLTNIYFLDNSYVDIGEYRFVGSVLWSNVDKESKYVFDKYSRKYVCNINHEKNQSLHKQCCEYIQNICNETKDKKIIMITHYLPSYSFINPKYLEDETFAPLNVLYASDCDYLIKDPIVLWIYGHTHSSSVKTFNGVVCCANPYGYPDENCEIDTNVIFELI